MNINSQLMSESDAKQIGRPTDYRLEFCQRAADLCLHGATDFEVAQEFDVSVRTLYRWKAEHPEFRQALKVGKDLSDDRVEASLYHRAVGYSYNAIKIMQNNGAPVIVPYVEHVPPDPGAMSLWLSNRRREDWKIKQALEHSGPNGAPIQHEDMRDSNLRVIEQLSARLPSATPSPTAAPAEGAVDAKPDAGAVT